MCMVKAQRETSASHSGTAAKAQGCPFCHYQWGFGVSLSAWINLLWSCWCTFSRGSPLQGASGSPVEDSFFSKCLETGIKSPKQLFDGEEISTLGQKEAKWNLSWMKLGLVFSGWEQIHEIQNKWGNVFWLKNHSGYDLAREIALEELWIQVTSPAHQFHPSLLFPMGYKSLFCVLANSLWERTEWWRPAKCPARELF